MATDLPICLISTPYLSILHTEASKQCSVVEWKDVEQCPDLKEKIVGVFTIGFMPTEWRLDQLINLKMISNHGAGHDHIDLEYCKSRGIKVSYIPDIIGDATADLAFALLLGTARRITEGDNLSKGGATFEVKNLMGREVSHATLGIVGLGAIGYRIAKRGIGFNMRILYHQRNRRVDDDLVSATYYDSLHAMLPECNFLVISCPLTKETYHLIAEKEMSLLPTGAYLINVSRGGVVSTDALNNALSSGHLGGAGLDVTEPEPLPVGHPLLGMPNVIVTPHWGTSTCQTRETMARVAVQNMLAGVRGEPIANQL